MLKTYSSPFTSPANVTANLYGSFSDALSGRIARGTTATPVSRHEPLLWVEKVSASTRDTIPTAWDQGAAYFSLEKRSGDAYGAATTIYARYFGGSGDLVGLHARAKLSVDGGRAYAGWFYGHNNAATPQAWHAVEMNGVNEGGDLGHKGDAQVLRVCMADVATDANRASAGIVIGKTAASPGGHNGFWSGLRVQADAIVSAIGSAWDANGEAILIDGHTDVTKKYGGIRVGTGNFKYALRTDEGTFLDATPIRLGASQKISFSSTNANVYIRSNTNRIEFGQTIDILNPEETTVAVRVNGTRVLSGRRTGWTAATGTATRTAFDTATVTTAQLAERVKALLDDAIFHGLIGP